MKLQISIFTILLGLGFLTTTAFAQSVESDYEIQQNFKDQYAEYAKQLEDVSSPDSAEKLIESIKEFDEKYRTHSELLNRVLHPNTYSERMQDLKRSSVIAQNRLQKINEQSQQLTDLENQLSDYEQNMGQLNQRTDSLKRAMEESIQSEKQLSGLLREYRENLEKRDDLILSFIDSMVVAYQQMDLQAMEDLENMDQKSRLESDGDALKMIHEISAENLDILERNADKLRLNDYIRMAEVQSQFQKMWTQLGDKIRQVYDGENADKLAGGIDENLSQWNQQLKNQTFAALQDSLTANNIQVSQFSNADEFYNALNSYLDTQITESEENRSEANYENFQRFREFWNRVELQWSSNFVDAEIMEQEQMATLNEKVDRWSENAQPRSNNILVYLLGASVLLAVALGVMLIRERRSKRD